MPPRAYGVIVHLFEISDCERVAGMSLSRLPLEVDGRTAQVAVTFGGETEIRDYADEAEPILDPVRFIGC